MKNSEKSQFQPEYQRFFGPGLALPAIMECLSGCQVVRIATAFFEPSGWALLEAVLEGKQVRLLIGREEGARDKVGDLLNEFLADVETGELRRNPILLRRVMAALRAGQLAIRLSENQISTALEARYLYHHAKLYIADASRLVVTSANFTRHGLLQSREAGYLVTEAEDVAYFVKQFDFYFEAAESVTDLFIEALEQLLDLRTPREVYNRSLLEIYGIPEELISRELPPPMDYQRAVISRILHSITHYHGSFLIASTGLGKTIIAAHTVAILRRWNKINSVIVVAPAGLKDMWMKAMRAARISSKEYSYQILSLGDWKKYRDVLRLEDELRQELSETLLILDESHHLRNAEDSDQERRLRNERILQARRQGAYILLLTATPYSRRIDDINNQLALLPQYEKQGEFFTAHVDWKISNVKELSDQPPVTILTAPTVIQHFARTDAEGRKYVEYAGGRKMYFPQVLHLRTVEFQNPYTQYLKLMKKDGLLVLRTENKYADSNLFGAIDVGGKSDPLIVARLMHQFCSSKDMVAETLAKLQEDGGYDKMRFARQEELTRFATRALAEIKKAPEVKFELLCDIIKKNPNEKLVIFCIYRATAKAVTDKLQKTFPHLKIETTVGASPDELETILDLFAPIANDKMKPGEENEFTEKLMRNKIDILVASEAMAEGFNLQDAGILVNYDLPWSVLQLAQRMGRLMRPWHEPREIFIYNFLPDTLFDQELTYGVTWRDRLNKRNAELKSFADVPVISERFRNEAYALHEVGSRLQRFSSEDLSLNEVMDFIANATQITTSSFLDDLAQLSGDEIVKLKALRMGFRSRVLSHKKEARLFLLAAVGRSVFPAVFNAQAEMIVQPYEISLALQLLRDHAGKDVYTQDFDLQQTISFEETCLAQLLKSLRSERSQSKIICALHFVPSVL